jgi:hypothetical protein
MSCLNMTCVVSTQMKVQRNHTEALLDALDKTLNSNTAWLHFDIYEASLFELSRFLIKQLRSGMFHSKLVENDWNRGWENLVSITYSKHLKNQAIILPLPGNSWNGKEELTYTEISEKKVAEYLTDLLTGHDKWLPKRYVGSFLKKSEARKIIEAFLQPLRSQPNKMVSYYLIEPDFLFTIEDYYESDHTQVGYFEQQGKDFVFAIVTEDHNEETYHMKLLMTNGGR